MKKKILLLTISAVVVVLSSLASAQVIPLSTGGVDSGWSAVVQDGTPVDITVNSIGYTGVHISIAKVFTGSFDNYGFFAPIVIQFQKTSQLALPSIIIDDETVTNLTNKMWYDYHFFISTDATNPRASFEAKFGSPDGDQLETVSYSVLQGMYGDMPLQMDFVNSQGQGVSNQPGSNVFRPGGVSGEINILTDALNMEVGDGFLLKEFPTVPEPATILLFGLGLAPIVARVKKASK